MANVRVIDRSFGAGELSPELHSRIDLAKWQAGLARCTNFITMPHGPAVNRPGFEFIHAVKNPGVKTRLIPFSYNNLQTFAIEVGAGYFRFHTQGATLLSGGVPYEISNPYAAADLMDIHYVQSADVLTLVHPSYPPKELRRLGPTNWTLTDINFTVPTNCPGYVGIIASGAYTGTGKGAALYAVTTINADTLEESVPSPDVTGTAKAITGISQANPAVVTATGHGLAVGQAVKITSVGGMVQLADGYYLVGGVIDADHVSLWDTGGNNIDSTGYSAYTSGGMIQSAPGVICNLTTAGNYNLVTWPAVAGAVRYNVYKYSNGLWGYIGQSGGTSFKDDNVTADISQTPPINETLFSAAGNYPGAVSYFEQRRVFAGTNNKPQNLWATRSGTESNMGHSIPVRSDDRIAIRIAAREASRIQHIVPAATMLLLTPSCEWRAAASSSDVLTPSSISVKPQSYNGSNNVSPVVVGNAVLFAQARGGHLREMSYSWQANGYLANDVCLLAPHLFQGNTVVDMAYSKAPWPILWVVLSNGALLGMTYVAEQQVMAWHQHTTDGTFESVAVVGEGNEEALYAVVNRTIGGATVRYVERLHTRIYSALADAFFVDCGLTYSGAPTKTISGLGHLEGKKVSVLGDGAVMPQQTVTSGAITLPVAVGKAQIGLPITADLLTLPMAVGIDGGAGQGRPKNVNKVWLRVNRSSSVFIGPGFDNLTEAKQRTTEPYGSPPREISDEIEVVLDPRWGSSGQVAVRQANPLPLTITSLTAEVAIGG